MKFRNLLAATAAVSLAAAPAIANAETASRTAATVEGESQFGGDSEQTAIWLAILAAAAIIVGVVIVAGNDDDAPASP